jgi:hypothetical protein
LRNSIDKLTESGVKKIHQTVFISEWHSFLKDKTSWQIIHNDDKNLIMNLECNIEDFLYNYGVGIGI